MKKYTLNIGGSLRVLRCPAVMGILNLTPDSFYDGGQAASTQKAVENVKKMVAAGMDILDIGAVSSRPGADKVSEDEERRRLIEPLKAICQAFPDLLISVDTFRSVIARESVNAGASMINDISGGEADPLMFETISELKVPYILMHMKGSPKTMQEDPIYENVSREVFKSLQDRVKMLKAKGVHDIIIDPGFGFGKTTDHNYELLSNLNLLSSLDLPVLVGISRKSMVNRVIGTKPETALNGTTVINTLALEYGADILRVHDVKEAKEAVKIFVKFKKIARKNGS